MIIKAIKIVYILDQKNKYITHCVYGREDYDGYNKDYGDDIDRQILNCVNNVNENRVDTYYLNEAYRNHEYYNTKFRSQNIHHTILSLIATCDVNDPKEIAEFNNYNNPIISIPIIWVDTRADNHPYLKSLPELSVKINYKKFQKLSKSVKTINFKELQ